MKPTAPTTLARLSTLAVGLTADAGIRLRTGETTWSWMPNSREIGVVDADLERISEEAALGLIAHETGHALGTVLDVDIGLGAAIDKIAAFTRPAWRREARERLDRHFRLPLLNGFEDGRVEAMMVHRFPAAKAWLQATSREIRGTRSDLRRSLHINQIGMVLADIHFIDRPRRIVIPSIFPPSARGEEGYAAFLDNLNTPLPFEVSPAVSAAVHAIRKSVFALRATFPHPGARAWQRPTPGGGTERVEASSPQEAVRAAATAAAALAAAHITPTLAALLIGDLRWIASWLPAPVHPFAIQTLCAKKPRDEIGPLAVDERALIEVIRAITGETAPLAAIITLPSTFDPKGLTAALHRLGMQIFIPGAPPAPLVVRGLAEALTRQLRPRFPPRRTGHAPRTLHDAGLRPHLPAVLRRAADPEASDRIWLRPPPRQHHDLVCTLLIDVSGSMVGESIVWVTAAVEVIGRSLSALNVPFTLQGYQDALIPFLPMGHHPAEALLAALPGLRAETEGSRPSGHNRPGNNDDGPCLDEAAAQLAAVPASDRLLIMISDGMLNGLRSDRTDLARALARWHRPGGPVRLLGVGAGPSHDHMRRRHPEGVMTARLPALPRLLAEAVGKLLRHPGP